jgi:hypothetical protein
MLTAEPKCPAPFSPEGVSRCTKVHVPASFA